MLDHFLARTIRASIAVLKAGGLSLALAATSPALAAEVTVDATYSASLGGFSIASGTLQFTLAGPSYAAAIRASVSGLATLISNRSAVASATGSVEPGHVSPRTYALAITGGPVPNEVSVGFNGNTVGDINATELRLAGWDNRVPLLPGHKRGVVDPLGALIIPMAAGKDPFSPAVCNRTLKIFDGRVRYDLHLVYGAREEVKGEPGSYSGPAIVCAVAYRPIAGHRILSPEQQRFERNIEFSIWFVPVGQTGVMLPHRILIQTQSGLLVVNATRFAVKGSDPIVADASTKLAANDQLPTRRHHRRHRPVDDSKN